MKRFSGEITVLVCMTMFESYGSALDEWFRFLEIWFCIIFKNVGQLENKKRFK